MKENNSAINWEEMTIRNTEAIAGLIASVSLMKEVSDQHLSRHAVLKDDVRQVDRTANMALATAKAQNDKFTDCEKKLMELETLVDKNKKDIKVFYAIHEYPKIVLVVAVLSYTMTIYEVRNAVKHEYNQILAFWGIK